MKPDDQFKEFLQEYRPELPPALPNQEQLLMAKIELTPQSQGPGSINIIAIAAAIAGMGLALGWWLNPPRRFASQAIDAVTLEAFLMDTWSGSVQRETLTNEQPVNEQWLSLINP